jgi:hypothetical protein
VVQPCKCATWSSTSLPIRFSLPLSFYTPVGGIRVFGVPLESLSFIYFFPHEVLNDDVQHIDTLLKLKDAYVVFGILIYCFV